MIKEIFGFFAVPLFSGLLGLVAFEILLQCERAPEATMVWSLTDKHLNCAAHGLMADFVVNEVLQAGRRE